MSTSQHSTLFEQLQSKYTAPGAPAIPAGPYDGINRPAGEVPHGQAPVQSAATAAPFQAAQVMQSAPAQVAPIQGLPPWLTLGAAPAQAPAAATSLRTAAGVVASIHPANQMSGYPDVVTMTAPAAPQIDQAMSQIANRAAAQATITAPPAVQSPNAQVFAQTLIAEMTAQAPQAIVQSAATIAPTTITAPPSGLFEVGQATAQAMIAEMTAQMSQAIVPPRLAEIAQAPAPAQYLALDKSTMEISSTSDPHAISVGYTAQVVDHVKPAKIAQAPASTPIQPPAQTDVVDRPSTPPAGRGRGFVLLDGCAGIGNPPWGGKLMSLAPLLRTAAARAAQAMGVPDYRMADYGKGAGAFVAMLEQVLDESGPGEGDMVVLDLGPESDHARATLQARASYTIRGTR